MSTIIKAEEASIKTTSIEIQCVRIGNKQMTLSVFRQLPEMGDPLYIGCGEDGDESIIVGELWGHINYQGIWYVHAYKGILYKMDGAEIYENLDDQIGHFRKYSYESRENRRIVKELEIIKIKLQQTEQLFIAV